MPFLLLDDAAQDATRRLQAYGQSLLQPLEEANQPPFAPGGAGTQAVQGITQRLQDFGQQQLQSLVPQAPTVIQPQPQGGLQDITRRLQTFGSQQLQNAQQAQAQVLQQLEPLNRPPLQPQTQTFGGQLGGQQQVSVGGGGGGGDLRTYARQAAQRAGIDPDIFVRQIEQESGFNPNAKSPAGAQGIAQFMPGTAAGMGVDPSDPYAALDAAARLDAQHLAQYGGDWSKALAAYNAGPGNVDKYGGVPPFDETQRYVQNILGGARQAVQGTAQAVRQAVMPSDQADVFPLQGYQGQVADHWGSVKGGSDLFAPRGTAVVAMHGGKVLESGYNSVGGNSVLIQGDDGLQYYYAHLDQAPSVQVGQSVSAGAYLGPVGDTGDAKGTGTHLHMGIGPDIKLGADKYGGTGGDFDAVGRLRSALSGQPAPSQDTAAGPAALAPPTPAARAASDTPDVSSPGDLIGQGLQAAGRGMRDITAAASDFVTTQRGLNLTPEQQANVNARRQETPTPGVTDLLPKLPELVSGGIQGGFNIPGPVGQTQQEADIQAGQDLANTVIGKAKDAGWQPTATQERFAYNTLSQITPSNVVLSLAAAPALSVRGALEGLAIMGTSALGASAGAELAPNLPEPLQPFAPLVGGFTAPVLGGLAVSGARGALRTPSVGQFVRDESGELRLPGEPPVPAESTRMYHGTGSTFERPLPGRFSEEGLYGPGYYLTSDPRIAGGIVSGGGVEPGAVLRQGYAQAAARTEPPAQLVALQDRWSQEAQQLADQLRTETDPTTRTQLQGLLEIRRDGLRQISSDLAQYGGPNVRAVDVPQDLRLFDMERPLTSDQATSIAQELDRLRPGAWDLSDPEVQAELRSWTTPDADGNSVYDLIVGETGGNKGEANMVLARAGFDGITHSGGKRIPMFDEAGAPIEHDVNVIFPESLDKLRNAISGTQGGQIDPRLALRLASAAAGGVAGNFTAPDDASLQERAARIGVGAAAGLVAPSLVSAPGVANFLRNDKPNATGTPKNPQAGLMQDTSTPDVAAKDETYRAMHALTNWIARELNINPREAQAAGWGVIRTLWNDPVVGRDLALGKLSLRDALKYGMQQGMFAPSQFDTLADIRGPSLANAGAWGTKLNDMRARIAADPSVYDQPPPASATALDTMHLVYPGAGAGVRLGREIGGIRVGADVQRPVTADTAADLNALARLGGPVLRVPGTVPTDALRRIPGLDIEHSAGVAGSAGSAGPAAGAVPTVGDDAARTAQAQGAAADVLRGGQPGAVSPLLAARLGGAAAGGYAGYATAPEDASPQERAARIGAGALGGAIAPSLLTQPGRTIQQLRIGSLAGGIPTLTHIAFNIPVQGGLKLASDVPLSLATLRFGTTAAELYGALQGLRSWGATAASALGRAGLPSGDQALEAATTGLVGLHGPMQNIVGEMARHMELWRVAADQATRDLGRTAQFSGPWRDAVAQYIASPTRDMLASANAAAQRASLSAPSGTTGQWIAEGVRTNPFVRFMLPIWQKGYSIATQGIELTPLGWAGMGADVARGLAGQGPYAGGNWGGRGASGAVTPLAERFRNALIGLALMYEGYNQASQGNITGEGPSDPAEQATLRQTGWQPDSSRINGRYVDNHLLGPVGWALSAGANAYEATHGPEQGGVLKPKATPQGEQAPTLTDMLGDIVAREGRYFTNETFLSSLGSALNLIGSGTQQGQLPARELASVLESLIPQGALLANIASAQDPYQRVTRAETPLGQIQAAVASRLPGERETLPPRLAATGRPLQNPQESVGLLLPRSSVIQRDPILEEMQTLGVKAPTAPTSISFGPVNEIRLTPAEQQTWEQYRGQQLQKTASALLASSAYQAMASKPNGDVLQRNALAKIVSTASSVADAQLRAELGKAGVAKSGRLVPAGKNAPVYSYAPQWLTSPLSEELAAAAP